MKRSQILQKLQELIEDTSHIDIPNSSYYNPPELAKEILDCVESFGMVPPEINAVHEWEEE